MSMEKLLPLRTIACQLKDIGLECCNHHRCVDQQTAVSTGLHNCLALQNSETSSKNLRGGC